MMSKPTDACVQPAQGPILKHSEAQSQQPLADQKEMKIMNLARVGHEAPDFEASAYLDGGFKNVRLSEYAGKWVVLCFYPGDFTFV